MSKKRLVVKIGSSSLTEYDGRISLSKIQHHVNAIAEIIQAGHQVILISSGAVAAGFKKIGYSSRPVTVSAKQAAAAVGQSLLMKGYADSFSPHHIITAQLLLTRNDFLREEQYSNAFNALNELLRKNVVPIINENDSTAIDELTFGDNDMLSALVSGFVHADKLIILTDIDGIYNDNPQLNPSAKKYTLVTNIDEKMLAKSQGTSTKVGTGGMKSKLLAARTAMSMGIDVFIGLGNEEKHLTNIIDGNGNGTYLSPQGEKTMRNKKQWIAFHSTPRGKIVIDQGAEFAVMHEGKSLLPVGIQSIQGQFKEHDVVEVYNIQGKMIGKGKINYDADQLKDIIDDSIIHATIKRSEAIHRDQWISF